METRNRHLRRPARVALAVALLALGACKQASQGPPSMGPPEVGVVTLHAQEVPLTRELPGRTRAFRVAEVRPQVSGVIESRKFTEGGRVRAGEPLYQIDDAVFRADSESARAALQRAEAVRDAARLTAARTAELRKVDAVSEQEKEDADAAVRQAEAEVAAAQATLSRRQLDIGFARIPSPISGHVGISSVTAGALVTANQETPLVTVQQLDPMYVDVNQSSLEWLHLQSELAAGDMTSEGDGAPVEIVLADGSRYPHPGRLQTSDVTVDPTTGSFALRVVVPNPEGLLRPGMYVQAVVREGVAQDAILAPQRGVTRDPKGNATALVVGADGKVELRDVEVSRTVGDSWLVESGLAAGDRVIVEGVQKVKPGAAVKAVEAADRPQDAEGMAAAQEDAAGGAAAAPSSPSEE